MVLWLVQSLEPVLVPWPVPSLEPVLADLEGFLALAEAVVLVVHPGFLVPPTAPSVLRLLILPQWPLLPTSGKPDFLWLAVLESDLAVCTQFLRSGRGRRTE